VSADETDVQPFAPFSRWAPILGRWSLEGYNATYQGQGAGADDPAIGLLRAPDSFGLTAGLLSTTIRFPRGDEKEPQGRIVFGFNPRTQAHYSAGLGGWRALYTIEQFLPQEGYVPVATIGRPEALERDRPYEVAVYLGGQSAMLDIDDVVVLDVPLPVPAEGSYIGLTARGRANVEFANFSSHGQAPEAFIVMQFGEPFDALYEEVIAPVCVEMGFQPVRADEFTGPGIIMQDIIEGIRAATVVIAEVTPVNANVFYELGFAQALGKPTILLADRAELGELPFDISGHRCIFYKDTIGGKPRVEADLRKHLGTLP
jgi:hypothetical protein